MCRVSAALRGASGIDFMHRSAEKMAQERIPVSGIGIRSILLRWRVSPAFVSRGHACPGHALRMKTARSQLCATMAALFLSGSFVFAQGLGGYAPGVNPSNPNDVSLRANPNDLTLPGGSNPHDLVRSRSAPRATSPSRNIASTSLPPVSSSLGHTYTVEPGKKVTRSTHRTAEQRSR
jgi:hypothetical protein